MKNKLLTFATLVASVSAINAADLKRPNIVWISAEDSSVDFWSCYGNPISKMPNVDALAKRGIRYNNAFTTAAICSPVRVGIITGMYQTSIGGHPMVAEGYMRGETGDSSMGYRPVPPSYVKAFPEYLRAHGYYTTNNGKTHYQFSFKKDVPKSIWDDASGGASFKNRPDKSQPFFSVFNLNNTHGRSGLKGKNPPKYDLSNIEVPSYYIDNDNSRNLIANHCAKLGEFDKAVGKIMDDLEKDGSADNTIIFIWSDHGTDLPRGKRWLYDSGTHIPLIVVYPDSMKGSECNELVNSVDFGPTVLSLAGVPVPSHMEGRPFLGDQKAEPREYVYACKDREDENYDLSRSVRSDKFLYIRNFHTIKPASSFLGSRNSSPVMSDLYDAALAGTLTEAQKPFMAATRPPEELYDVVKDPENIHNLANDPAYKKQLETMRKAQNAWRVETGDLGMTSEDELYRRFYPDGKPGVTCRPRFVVNEPGSAFRADYDGSEGPMTIQSPAQFTLSCSTEGASMVYRLCKKGEQMPKRWMLLGGPVNLVPGEYQIEALAHRYGYKESEPLNFELIVE